MRLLYLDLATVTGWAVGDVTDHPAFGSIRLPKTGRNLGQYGNAFEDWLCDKIAKEKPTHVGFESPFLGAGLNLNTTRKLTGLCFVTEMACEREGIGVSETNYSKVRVYALGDRKLPKLPAKERKIEWKKRMVQAAQFRGYDVHDDNEADAVLGWEYTAKTRFPNDTAHLLSFHEMQQPEMEGL